MTTARSGVESEIIHIRGDLGIGRSDLIIILTYGERPYIPWPDKRSALYRVTLLFFGVYYLRHKRYHSHAAAYVCVCLSYIYYGP